MTDPFLSVMIGWDVREIPEYHVTRFSAWRHASRKLSTHPVMRRAVWDRFGIKRPFEWDAEMGRWRDKLSGEWCSTEFSLTRFLVPRMLGFRGWALFLDCDMMFRTDPHAIFAQVMRDPGKAVYVVKHDHTDGDSFKMDGQHQSYYQRKNWSSVALYDCAHEAHRRLDPERYEKMHKHELHGFSWLADEEIGSLPTTWNHLVGVSPDVLAPYANVAHFTLGSPRMLGYKGNGLLEHEWLREREIVRAFQEEGRTLPLKLMNDRST